MLMHIAKLFAQSCIITLMIWGTAGALIMGGLNITALTFPQSWWIAWCIVIVAQILMPEPPKQKYFVDPAIENIPDGQWVRVDKVGANKD